MRVHACDVGKVLGLKIKSNMIMTTLMVNACQCMQHSNWQLQLSPDKKLFSFLEPLSSTYTCTPNTPFDSCKDGWLKTSTTTTAAKPITIPAPYLAPHQLTAASATQCSLVLLLILCIIGSLYAPHGFDTSSSHNTCGTPERLRRPDKKDCCENLVKHQEDPSLR